MSFMLQRESFTKLLEGSMAVMGVVAVRPPGPARKVTRSPTANRSMGLVWPWPSMIKLPSRRQVPLPPALPLLWTR